jgi:glucokinase
MLLIGDIGGTNTRLVLFENNEKLKKVKERRFLSANYSTLSVAVHKFLKEENVKIDKACFGIAGPVINNRCHLTNLSWVIDAKELEEELNIPHVFLLNDLEATAYGIDRLSPHEFFVINEGKKQKGNAALICPGTGLGEAGLFWDGKKHTPFACEGGHANFAARDELEVELFYHLRKKYGHVSYERAISGPGINELYRFLVDTKKEEKIDLLEKELAANDPSMIITQKGVKQEIKVCERVMNWFVSLLGAEAGNVTLRYFALSGVYLGGGIPHNITEVLRNGEFMKGFIDKGRFRTLMKGVPVKVILNDRTAILGAAYYAYSHNK